jgi:hypothetical protein
VIVAYLDKDLVHMFVFSSVLASKGVTADVLETEPYCS